jgi:YVTN family beta-propeller protein
MVEVMAGTPRLGATLFLTVVFTVALAACTRAHNDARRPGWLYVSDETGGHVDIVDPAAGTLVDRIRVGKRPRGIVLSPDGSQLYVALSGSPIGGPGVDESRLPPADRAADGIGVVDLATRKVVRRYESGIDPEAFGLSPDGKTLYISNEDAGAMTVLDLATGAIRGKVKVGAEPEGVTVTPDSREVFVSCEGTNEVVAVDTSSLAIVARMTTAARPRATIFTSDGATGFVSSETGGAVTVLDARQHSVTGTIPMPRQVGAQIPPRPMGLALSPDGRELFVSLGRAKSIAVIGTSTRTVTRTIDDVGIRPWGIALTSDGRTLYSANGPSGDVSVVDVAIGKTTSRIAVGGSPWGVIIAR